MLDELLGKLTPRGQEHLLAFWDDLDPRQREGLAAEIHEIDFDQIEALYDGPPERKLG